ncbi:hypothetical protein KUL42_10080 [Alteromonas sp. KUL42]|nr:hypothetical protein KUL42_10080 [Alteromonas sp. KUL42]
MVAFGGALEMSISNPFNQCDVQQLEAQLAIAEAELIKRLKVQRAKQKGEWCELLPNSEALSDFIVNNTDIVETYAELIVIKSLVNIAISLAKSSPLN